MAYILEINSYQLLKLEILAGNKWFDRKEIGAYDADEWGDIVKSIKYAEEIDDGEDSQ